MFTLTRSEYNPIISPLREHPWESAATFNGCPIIQGRKTTMVYRAMSEPDLLKEPHIRTSVIGRADSKDGIHYENRAVLITPDSDFDRYGCEDPRVTKIGSTYYIFYTALHNPFNGTDPQLQVGVNRVFYHHRTIHSSQRIGKLLHRERICRSARTNPEKVNVVF